MIAVTCFEGKTVAVFGLGMTGIGTAKALEAGGAKPLVWDDNENARRKAADEGLIVADLKTLDWNSVEALLLSPGVPLTHPEPAWPVKLANSNQTEIIGDVELFFREQQHRNSKAKVIGITGTNGKSTTTALIAHILQANGLRVEMGGNIGRAVLDLAEFEDDIVYVLELSSYQIDLTPTLPLHVAILMNLTPDHIDRHGTFEHYADVKARIFDQLAADGLAIAGLSTPVSKEKLCGLETKAKKVWIGKKDQVKCCMGAGVELREEHALRAVDSKAQLAEEGEVISLEGISSLRGIHNGENAGIALAVAHHLGLSNEQFLTAVQSFPGLPHRMEQVGQIGDVLFINDSKATNAESTLHALRSFENIHWIVGGQAKEGGITSLSEDWNNVTKAYLIGEAADVFATTLQDKLDFVVSGTLEKAVKDIWQQAQNQKAVILLSPACASFDQYPNFMIRGDAFKKAVDELKETQALSS